MKQIVTIILCFICSWAGANAQRDGIIPRNMTSQVDSPQAPVHHSIQTPPKPLVPVDTAAALKQLNFDKLNYDSLFSISTDHYIPEQPITNHVTAKDFVLPVLLLVLLAYVTWLRYAFAKELGENITVILNTNLGQQIYRDREFSANIFKLLTFVNFAFATGVFVFLLANNKQVDMPFDQSALNIAAFVGAIALLYLLKGLVYQIVGYSFKLSNALKFYRFNTLVIYHLLGIAMLPLIILSAFAGDPVADWALNLTLVLLGIAMILRIIKGFAALRLTPNFHFVYFLLYICALEVAPILIAIKAFEVWN